MIWFFIIGDILLGIENFKDDDHILFAIFTILVGIFLIIKIILFYRNYKRNKVQYQLNKKVLNEKEDKKVVKIEKVEKEAIIDVKEENKDE